MRRIILELADDYTASPARMVAKWAKDAEPVRELGEALVFYRKHQHDIWDQLGQTAAKYGLWVGDLLDLDRATLDDRRTHVRYLATLAAFKACCADLAEELASRDDQGSVVYEITHSLGADVGPYTRVPAWVQDKEGFLLLLKIYNLG